MNSVEKIKAICKERKIPISRLEKDLGFSNGYIGQLKKGSMPYERLVQVANYLNVSGAFLTDGNENKPAPLSGNEPLSLDYFRSLSAEELLRVMKDVTQALSEKQ